MLLRRRPRRCPPRSLCGAAEYTDRVTTVLQNLNATAERWVRWRFAFPLVVALAAALLLTSEITYRNTTSTLRGGIELTDARIEATRLLQLLSDAETAQFAFLVTGEGARLTEYDRAKAELPRVQSAVAAYFSTLGPRTGASYRRTSESIARAIAQLDRTLGLARNGQLDRALALARSGSGQAEVQAARAALLGQLAEAAGLQQQARLSLFEAFQLNRLAVGVLTGVALASLLLFMRQMHTQDRERAAQRAALLRERENLEIDVARRTERLAELTRHLQSVREDERAHLARELHDELGGLLTASKLDLARTRAKAGDPTEVLVRLDRLNDNLNKGIALKRRIIEDLRPSALSNFGLAPALQNLCDDMGKSLDIPVQLEAAPFDLAP